MHVDGRLSKHIATRLLVLVGPIHDFHRKDFGGGAHGRYRVKGVQLKALK